MPAPALSAPSRRRAASVLGAALLGALLLPSAPAALAAQAVEIRYQFSEGMDLRYEMVQSSTTEIPGMGNMTQEQRQVLRMEVLSVDAQGNARIRQTIERIQMDMNSPMGNQSWDSADESAPPAPEFAGVGAMVGEGLEVTIGPDGSLVDAGDLSGWLDAMMADADPEVRAMLQQTMGEEAIENMVSQSFQALPPQAISPGESWEHTVEIPLPFGRMSSTSVYTLEGVETVEGRRVATLAVTGRMGELIAEEGNPMAGMVQIEGGDISGRVLFDLDRGIFLSTRTETVMRMAAMGQAMESATRLEMRLLP